MTMSNRGVFWIVTPCSVVARDQCFSGTYFHLLRGEVIEALVEILVVVFCVMSLCSVVVGYQRFREPYCFLLQGEVTGDGEKGIDIGPECK
jgi:hypothetical protein